LGEGGGVSVRPQSSLDLFGDTVAFKILLFQIAIMGC